MAGAIQKEMDFMQQNGFSAEEAQAFGARQRLRMEEAGFSNVEIDKEFGIMPFDEKRGEDEFSKNLDKNLPALEEKAFNENLEKTSGQPDINKGISGLPKFDPKSTGFDPIINAGDPNFPRPAVSFADFWEAGTGMSIEGLKQGKLPEVYVPDNAGFFESVLAQVATLKGDTEGYLYGAALGAATAAGVPVPPHLKAMHTMGSAGAVTEGMRAYYIDQIQNGSIRNGREFSDRIGGIILDAFKGYVTLATTSAAGIGTGKLLAARHAAKHGPVKPHLATRTGNFFITSAAEVGTLVTVGNALEGQLPDFDQIAEAATLVFGLKAAAKAGSKAFDYGANLFKKKGVDPWAWTREADSDVTVFQDSHSTNRPIPRKFEEPVSRPQPEVGDVAVETAVSRIETAMRTTELKAQEPGTDLVAKTQAELRTELKKQGFSEDAIESQIAEATQQASDNITDHTLAHVGMNIQQGNAPANINAAITGKPFTGTLIRGQAEEGAPPSTVIPILGEGRYTTNSRELAEAFGPVVTTHKINLKNPLVIESDAQWAALTRRAGWENPNPSRLGPNKVVNTETDIANLRSVLEKDGHDGVVVRANVKDNPDGLLAKLFDGDQVVEFSKSKPPPPPPPPPPPKPGDVGDARDNILSKVSFAETRPQKARTYGDLYTAFIDDLDPIRNDVKAAFGPNTLPVSKDPYKLARIHRGLFSKVHTMHEFGTIDFKTFEINGISLKEALAPIRNDNQAMLDFRAYALGKDAIDSFNRGVDVGFDLDTVKTFVQDKNNIKKFEPILKNVVTFQNNVAKYAMDGGLITKEGFDFIVKNNKNHVPMFRLLEPGEFGGLSKHGAVKNPFKKRKGSDLLVLDPIESIIKNTHSLVGMTDKNAVSRAYIEMADATGKPEMFYSIVKPTIKGVEVTEAEMKKFLQEAGISDVPQDVMTIFRAAQQPLRANQIALFEKGKRTVYEARPEVAEAFRNMDRPSSEMMLRLLSLPARALREGTVISPDFIARNILRDQPLAFAMSKGLYLPVIDMIRGMTSLIKKDKDFVNFMLGGGANSTIVAIDRMYIQGEIGKLSAKTGLGRKAWNVVTSPLQYLAIISEIMENATRLGEFKKVQRKFDKGKTPTKSGIQQGGFGGREVAVDFARKGAQMLAISKLAAFLNPHIQGVDRLMREQIENPIGSTAKLFAAITLPTILLWLHNKDDERYQGTPRWVKDMYWIIYTDNHTYRIPKSHEAGILYGSMVERILDSYFADDPEAFKGFAQRIIESTVANPLPTIFAPMIDQFANRSLFSGKPLIPRAAESLMPEYQYKPYTTELTKEIARVFGAFPGLTKHAVDPNAGTFTGGVARALTTPILVDNYIRSWTGGMGSYIMELTDKALREAGALPNPIKREDTLADTFFIKAFVVRHPSMSNQHIQDFYDAYSVRMKTFSTLKKLREDGDFEAEERLLQFDPNADDNLSQTKQALAEHAKEVRDIERLGEAGVIPRDQIGQIIDQLYFNMIQIAKDAVEDMKEMDRIEKQFDKNRGVRSIAPRSTQGTTGNAPVKRLPQESDNVFPQPGSPIQNEAR